MSYVRWLIDELAAKKKRGKTQKALAEFLDIPASAVSNMVRACGR